MAKALYREYRPKTFDEVLGQDRVTNVLRNQVKSSKISHAYIFSGERGTGKTSCAKIFAKAINCLNPQNGSPCLECENCRAIEEETTIDVVEMDAASNRRIDDIRNLKDSVIYPPNILKKKVYIIDEAHMITREAFNALLKIMEEPPSHLVFILATTEIEKVPTTILSRVQKFEFNKIDENQIKIQIDKILSDRNISMEAEAIDLIIKKANGAMRDALSILDQVISLENESYDLAQVENILGVVDFYEVNELTSAIISKNSQAALDIVFNLRHNNKSNKDILDSLISYFNDIMIYGITHNDRHFDNEERLGFIKERVEEVSDVEISDYLDILIEYTNKLKVTENTDVLTEVCILRLVNLKSISNLESRIRYLEAQTGESLADEINRILDSRLKNIDLSAVQQPRVERPQKPLAVENHNSTADVNVSEMDEGHVPNFVERNIREEHVEVSSKEEPTRTDAQMAESEQIPENHQDNGSFRLSPSDEAAIKNILTETAGGAINGLFSEEGFNYDLDDSSFTLYVKNDFYKIFIETKVAAIEEKIGRILLHEPIFYVESPDNKKNNSSKAKKLEEKEEVGEDDSISRLRDVFGDELVLE